MKSYKKGLKFVLLLIIFSSLFSCKKFVDIEAPSTQVTGQNVFMSDISAISALNGIYATLSTSAYNSTKGLTSLSRIAGLSADELQLWNGINSPIQTAYFTNSLAATDGFSAGGEIWSASYTIIYACNSAIEGLSASNVLTPIVKRQLLGEAKFIRALHYFYLVNLYGEVPLALTTDYSINRQLGRSSINNVYLQIINDLKEAQTFLSVDYLDITLFKPSVERVRPNKWAATALLSRVYLFNNEWANAENEASVLIDNKSLFDTVTINNVFLKNSKETIWQLQPVNSNWNTEDARAFIFPTASFSNNNPYSINTSLLNSFELNDKRAINGNWIKSILIGGTTYYYPYKYKSATSGASVTEYLTVLRIGELYLIRSEARAQQNKLSEAQSDLNVIRTRAGLANTTASTQPTLLTAILHERQVELFTEWGHRWIDLKRTNTVDAIMSVITPQKGGTWETQDKLYPIPLDDLRKDLNLTQNPGY